MVDIVPDEYIDGFCEGLWLDFELKLVDGRRGFASLLGLRPSFRAGICIVSRPSIRPNRYQTSPRRNTTPALNETQIRI